MRVVADTCRALVSRRRRPSSSPSTSIQSAAATGVVRAHSRHLIVSTASRSSAPTITSMSSWRPVRRLQVVSLTAMDADETQSCR